MKLEKLNPKPCQQVVKELKQPKESWTSVQIDHFIYLSATSAILKHMMITGKAEPSNIKHAIDTDYREGPPIRIPDESTNLKFDAPDGIGNTQDPQGADVSPVHCKATESRHSQLWHHTALNESSCRTCRTAKTKTGYPTSIHKTVMNS